MVFLKGIWKYFSLIIFGQYQNCFISSHILVMAVVGFSLYTEIMFCLFVVGPRTGKFSDSFEWVDIFSHYFSFSFHDLT